MDKDIQLLFTINYSTVEQSSIKLSSEIVDKPVDYSISQLSQHELHL